MSPSTMVRHSILCMHFLLNADCRMDPMSLSKYMNETNSDIISYVLLNATWKLELLKVSRNPYLMVVVRLNWKRPKWLREEIFLYHFYKKKNHFHAKTLKNARRWYETTAITIHNRKAWHNESARQSKINSSKKMWLIIKKKPSQLNALNENDRKQNVKMANGCGFCFGIVFHIPI